MRDPIVYRAGCGCAQHESGATSPCLRHLDWDAQEALAWPVSPDTWRTA